MATANFRIWRGDGETGDFENYSTEIDEGMVVLDAVHQIQAESAPDLAVRWNCKAGKCGSCSAEVNGNPKLMCMTRMSDLPEDEAITIEPMKAFKTIRDLVTDVSWNYRAKEKIKPFKPRKPDAEDGTWRMAQEDIERVQEFRKCIECFLCQDVCHVLREHDLHEEFIGPRLMVHNAALEMHPLDTGNRLGDLKDDQGIGYCNITKCCTNVCPEEITITDNAIIPLKERVVGEFYEAVQGVPGGHVRPYFILVATDRIDGLLQKRRFDGAGVDRHHTDIVFGVIQRQLTHQRQVATLARRVGRDPFSRLESLHAGRVDDHPSSATLHHGNAVLDHKETALEVHVDDPVPLLLGHLVGGHITRSRLYSHVVTEDVHPAPGFRRGLHERTAHLARGHVGVDVADPVAGRGDLRTRIVVDVGAEHAGALTGEGADDPPADAFRAPGYDDHFSFKSYWIFTHHNLL